MTDNEFVLFDRITKIQSVIEKYGEENFYLSFSGGKDSTVLSELLDMAIPDNKIPRVYANTGIELNIVRDFVFDMAKNDSRVEVVKPSVPIKKMLEQDGYPFKSKEHSYYVSVYQKNGENAKTVQRYLCPAESRAGWGCPKVLKYQFRDDFDLKLSDKCCDNLKKQPLKNWEKKNNKRISIVGIRREEGGQRNRAKCLAFTGGQLKQFHPLSVVTDEWEDWFIDKFGIELCEIYKEPYNFKRTGCKGCPFALDLQHELDVLQEFFPNERKQCEIIWKPVYDEYRRLGYRLKDGGQISFF